MKKASNDYQKHQRTGMRLFFSAQAMVTSRDVSFPVEHANIRETAPLLYSSFPTTANHEWS